MGRLYYGAAGDQITMPDDELAHLKIVVATKLRRSESFTLSWRHGTETDPRLSSVWMHCSIPLRFEFDGGDADALDRTRLQQLAEAANTNRGIVLELIEPARAAELVRAA
ncbi:hypothetical protein [Microbacterium sp. bgisy189]|uniref:DUF7882 family protein n=1 Tax=Microbacterium sp. bgisy189 TaxID=3413798 RepID=UPI003EBF495C